VTRRNLIIWILLIALTTLGFVLGEQGSVPIAILAVAAAKGLLVARQFMELRNAAVVWTFALATVFGGILVIALFLA
jgi:hypothetical protein